jgi:peptidyl-prolyl cis-trans isomerase SurA
MIKYFTCLFTILCLIASTAQAGREGIAAVVNNVAITNSDVNDRLKLIILSTGLPQENKELVERVRGQVVDMLVDESLRVQEAKRLDITVTDADIDDGFKQIAANNNTDADKFKAGLKARGIRLETLADQIRAQVAWGKVVQREVRPKVEVTDADIDTEIEQLRRNIGKTQYLLAEILLTVDESRNANEVETFAANLAAQLKKQPENFPRAAREFSQASGAQQGGNMGWVLADQLPPELAVALTDLQDKSISTPIRTNLGYHILLVRERRTVSESLIPKREEIMQLLGNMRLERAARRYYQDLRSSSFIEKRG